MKKKPPPENQLSVEFTTTIKCTGFTEDQLQDYTVNWLCSDKYRKAVLSGEEKKRGKR